MLVNSSICRSIHDVKATDMGMSLIVINLYFTSSSFCFTTGADTVRFKAEVNFDGREVAKAHVDRLNLESLLVVWLP